MIYSKDLIRLDNSLATDEGMFSLALLKAKAFTMVLNDTRCFLDGTYLLCLNKNESVGGKKDKVQITNLSFAPNFININLNFDLIASEKYHWLCKKHQYPDFRIFCERNDEYVGIIPLSNTEFELATSYFNKIDMHIKIAETIFFGHVVQGLHCLRCLILQTRLINSLNTIWRMKQNSCFRCPIRYQTMIKI